MNLIWHTALSVFDLGSSILYSLLGRDLTESEIALIELLFKYMRKTKYVTRRSTIRKRLNLMEANRMETDTRELENELRLSRLHLECMINDFLDKYDLHCKDLLLISSRHDGYNLLQLSIESLMATSFRWLDAAYKFYLNDQAATIHEEYEKCIDMRLNFIRLLLEKYSCDPNRGILLSNKSKYTIGGVWTSEDEDEEEEEETNANEKNNNNNSNNEVEKIRIKIASQQQKIRKYMQKTASSSSISGTMFSQTSNLNLKSVTNYTDESSLRDLNQTPIDNPLLILCCVYNCHNLLNQTNSSASSSSVTANGVVLESNTNNNNGANGTSNGDFTCYKVKSRRPSEKSNKNEASTNTMTMRSNNNDKSKTPFTSLAATISEPNKNFYKRRHTIHCDNSAAMEFVNNKAMASSKQQPTNNRTSSKRQNQQPTSTQTPVTQNHSSSRMSRSYMRNSSHQLPPHSCHSSSSASSRSASAVQRSRSQSVPSDHHNNHDDEINSSTCSSASSFSQSSSSSSSSSVLDSSASSSSSLSMSSTSDDEDISQTSSSSSSSSSTSAKTSTEVLTQLPTHCPSCNSSLISDFISDHSIFGSAFNDSIESLHKFNKTILGLTHSNTHKDNDHQNEVADETDLANMGKKEQVRGADDYNFDSNANTFERKPYPTHSNNHHCHNDDNDYDYDYDDDDEYDDEDEDSDCSDDDDENRTGETNSDSNMDEDDEDEDEDEDDDDLDSNIFDYYDLENADEENYFNRYDFDYNSYCFRNYLSNYNEMRSQQHQQQLQRVKSTMNNVINGSSSISLGNLNNNNNNNNHHQPLRTQASLSTSIHSLRSSSNHASAIQTNRCCNINNTNQPSVTYSSKNTFIYEQLNRQRLEIVDMLLKQGADKYLVGKLSCHNVEKLNRKSLGLLKKWYAVQNGVNNVVNESENKEASIPVGDVSDQKQPISKSSSVFSISKIKQQQQQQQQERIDENAELEAAESCATSTAAAAAAGELRPLSPIMASLCLDDVDLFARLYKHHQTLFNYFKPDEDYELIYYAIKFQSKSCLIYLLSNASSDSCFPSLLEQAHDPNSRLTLPGENKVPRTVHLRPHSDGISATCNKSKEQINQLELQLSKNVNTMFYILENTRSAKIVRVLLRCGFDLTKREPLTGNTALHCLFNASKSQKYYDNNEQFNAKQKMLIGTKRCILNEFHKPKSLSRILFVMLKMGGLKTHVNTLNNDKKLCTQVLFEWDELVSRVFFYSSSPAASQETDEAVKSRNEWKREFKQCVKLLLKSGADMLLTTSYMNSSNELQVENHNCIDVLFTSLLKHALKNSNSTLDVDFLFALLNDCIDLNALTTNLMRQSHYYHHPMNHHHSASTVPLSSASSQNGSSPGAESPHRIMPKECIVEKFIEVLLRVRLDSFANAYKVFKLISHFQKCFNSKLRSRSANLVSGQVVKTLIDRWINEPNFLNSSNQFEKNRFVKLLVFELILNDLYDPNDSSLSYSNISEETAPNTTGTTTTTPPPLLLKLEPNNLINYCVKLLFTSAKTGYQIELVSDLMRTLVQYGAWPTLDANLSSDPHSTTSFLTSVGELMRDLRSARKSAVGEDAGRRRRHKRRKHGRKHRRVHRKTATASSHRRHKSAHNHHSSSCGERKHSRHSSRHRTTRPPNYFLDYFFGTSGNNNGSNGLTKNTKSEYDLATATSEMVVAANKRQNHLLASSNPILLLTPSPSYLSLLHIQFQHHHHHHHHHRAGNTSPKSSQNQVNGTAANSAAAASTTAATSTTLPVIKSTNIVIESSILFLDQYKRLIKLLLNSIESNYPHNLIISTYSSSSSIQQQQQQYPFCRSQSPPLEYNSYHHHHHLHHHHYHHHHYHHHNHHHRQKSHLESLLDKMTSQPRSLKSLARRSILNTLVGVQKRQRTVVGPEPDNRAVSLVKNQVLELNLPKRIQNYLLFIN